VQLGLRESSSELYTKHQNFWPRRSSLVGSKPLSPTAASPRTTSRCAPRHREIRQAGSSMRGFTLGIVRSIHSNAARDDASAAGDHSAAADFKRIPGRAADRVRSQRLGADCNTVTSAKPLRSPAGRLQRHQRRGLRRLRRCGSGASGQICQLRRHQPRSARGQRAH
jgi:hypothetical protein